MYCLISLQVKVKAETLIAYYEIGETYMILKNKHDLCLLDRASL